MSYEGNPNTTFGNDVQRLRKRVRELRMKNDDKASQILALQDRSDRQLARIEELKLELAEIKRGVDA